MRFTLIIAVIVILFTACSKKITTTQTTIKDSTIIKETVRLDTVRIKGDTVRVTHMIDCDSLTNKPKPFKINKRSGRASANVEVKADGSLQVEAVCDSLEKIVALMDREIFRLRQEKVLTTVYKQPSQIKIWFDWTCRILAAIFILFIGFNAYKALT